MLAMAESSIQLVPDGTLPLLHGLLILVMVAVLEEDTVQTHQPHPFGA